MNLLSKWLTGLFSRGAKRKQSDMQEQPLKFSVKRRASELKHPIKHETESSFKVRLCPDEFHLPDVGQLKSGAKYWIDRQVAELEGKTHDFLATYVFDDEGRLIWHEIKDLGARDNEEMRLTPALRDAKDLMIGKQLKRLGHSHNADIWVFPFSVIAFGHTFGLVVRSKNDSALNEDPLVDVLPGMTLMFHAPWDEGVYAS